MKISMKQGVLAATILALGVSVAGTAAAARDGEAPRAERAEKHEQQRERFAKHVEQRFEALEKALSLRPDQQQAWAAYRESFTPQVREERRERAATAPERAARHEAFAEARLNQARTVRTATEALYAKLNAEQRKVLDEHRSGGPKGHGPERKGSKPEPRR